MKCDCHGKNHHDGSLTLLPHDSMNGDPVPSIRGAPSLVVWCDKGLQGRERNIKALERGRRTWAKRRAA